MRKAFLEKCLADGLSLKQIGELVDRNPSTISYHLKKHGLKPVNHGKHASRGAIPESKLRAAVATGAPLREIAGDLNRSYSTIRYWIERYGIEYHGIKGNRELALAARARGETVIQLRCRHHGLTDFYVAPGGDYKCKLCRKERVAQWRRDAKDELVRAAGGCCALCGYSKCLGALQFHHLDPSKKSFGLAMRGRTKSLEKLLAEARKCLLLCANCHAEVERGAASIPKAALREAWRDDGNLRKRAA